MLSVMSIKRDLVLPLNSQQLNAFRAAIRVAVEESESCYMTYTTEWIYDLPTHSVEVGGKMIDANYQFNFGEADLDQLVAMGFLRKLSESSESSVTLEKVVVYEVVS